MNTTHDAIAYFSMEIGLETDMPTFRVEPAVAQPAPPQTRT
jgi:hypothetical protein